MSQPFDSATTQLTTLSAAMRTVYRNSFLSMHSRFGRKTNRMFKPSKQRIDGDGFTIQVSPGNFYGARVDTDVNGDFPTPRAHTADSFRVNLSETPGSNHMRRLAASLSITDLDRRRKASTKAAAEDFVKSLVKQSMENIGETMALHRHLPSTALLGQINGTPRQNDNRRHAACTATPAAGTGARFPIDNGTIAGFPQHLVIDSYTGTTYDFTLEVTDYNPRDNSVGVYATNAAKTAIDTSQSLSALADNDSLYISGEKDKNILSIGHWYSDPSSGDSFFTRDRTNPLYRWLQPHKSGPTTATQFTKTHLDDAAIQMGYITEESEGGYIILTTPELEQRFRNEIGNDIFIDYPSNDQKGKLLAQYGFDGSMFRHPHLGRVMLQSDPFAPSTKIRGFRVGDWETLFAPDEGGDPMGFEWMPGQVGMWYRMPSSVAGGGDTTTYRADGYLLMCDICLDPRNQFEIENLTT